jgi:hypothetical protein
MDRSTILDRPIEGFEAAESSGAVDRALPCLTPRGGMVNVAVHPSFTARDARDDLGGVSQ